MFTTLTHLSRHTHSEEQQQQQQQEKITLVKYIRVNNKNSDDLKQNV
jgi:hypothetical protein